MTHPLHRRRDAAQATLDKFKDQPFAWGRFDCARLAAFHLRKMGRPVQIAKAGSYGSARSAAAALRRLGFKTLCDMADAHFEQIPPAFAIVGDLMELPGDHPIGALGVACGNGRLLGFHEDAVGAVVVQPIEYLRAWLVDPR